MPDSRPVRWTVVIPVKGSDDAKSRFGGAPGEFTGLALAIALDTVSAALEVADVVVVTSAEVAPAFEALGAVVVRQEPVGLAAAIRAGLDAAPLADVAVLLGDLPALLGPDLAGALDLALAHPRAMVPDADGSGTVLITARDSAAHAPAFGAGSRAAHFAAGYVELAVPAASGLRTDVDTLADLRALESRVGPRTAAALGVVGLRIPLAE